MKLKCSKCKQYKNTSEFYKKDSIKRGFAYYCKECEKIQNKANRIKYKEKRLEYDRNRKEKKKEYWQNWKKNNPEKYKANVLKNRSRLSQKMISNVLHRMRAALKGNFNASITYLNCDIDFLIKHIESQFNDKMNWGNYNSEWEIDHIIPCSMYDLSDKTEMLKCFNYKNMRPLGVSENRKKQATINKRAVSKCRINNLLPSSEIKQLKRV